MVKESIMKIELWQAKLAAAKAVLRHRQRMMNEATRAHTRVLTTVFEMETKIANYLAKTK